MAGSFSRCVDIASWASLVLTVLGIALFIGLSPFSHIDEEGVVREHFGLLALVSLTFFVGVLGMVATKILSALLIRLQREPAITGEKRGA